MEGTSKVDQKLTPIMNITFVYLKHRQFGEN